MQDTIFPQTSKTTPTQSSPIRWGQATEAPSEIFLHFQALLAQSSAGLKTLNYLMQAWQFLPCFVVLNHTLQAVTEVIVGSFKIFRGQPSRSIAPQVLSGVGTTRRTPSTCAHSLDVKKKIDRRLKTTRPRISFQPQQNLIFKCNEWWSDSCNSLAMHLLMLSAAFTSHKQMQLNKEIETKALHKSCHPATWQT